MTPSKSRGRLAALAITTLVALASTCAPLSAQAQAAPAAKPLDKMSKPELVSRLVQLQQGQVQNAARSIIDPPVLQLMQQAAAVVQQRVPAEQRDATMKELQAEARKYVDEISPLLRDSIQRHAAATMAPMFDEKLTEEEMRQLITIFEAPVLRKYEQIAPELQRVLREKLLGDTRGKLEERFRALEQTFSRKLGLVPAASGAASGPRKP